MPDMISIILSMGEGAAMGMFFMLAILAPVIIRVRRPNICKAGHFRDLWAVNVWMVLSVFTGGFRGLTEVHDRIQEIENSI